MNEQLIKFIELCIMDGVVTDKEREVIFRKSKELGVPEDECEIILEGIIQQHLNNNSVLESSNEMLHDNRTKDENNKTLSILFKKSISKPLVIDTLNSLTDLRKEKEVALKTTIQDYEKLFERDKEIYPIQESLSQEKQETETKVLHILEKRSILNDKVQANARIARELEEKKRELEEKKREFLENSDPLFEEAANIILENQVGAASFLQRKLKIGYNRAGRILDYLEMAGIVGPFNGSKTREVIPKSKERLNELMNEFYGYEN